MKIKTKFTRFNRSGIIAGFSYFSIMNPVTGKPLKNTVLSISHTSRLQIKLKENRLINDPETYYRDFKPDHQLLLKTVEFERKRRQKTLETKKHNSTNQKNTNYEKRIKTRIK